MPLLSITTLDLTRLTLTTGNPHSTTARQAAHHRCQELSQHGSSLLRPMTIAKTSRRTLPPCSALGTTRASSTASACITLCHLFRWTREWDVRGNGVKKWNSEIAPRVLNEHRKAKTHIRTPTLPPVSCSTIMASERLSATPGCLWR